MKTSKQRQHLIFAMTLCLLFAACAAYCTDYYVATDGNDSNDGSFAHPFKTINKGVSMVAAGSTVYVRGGSYYYTAKFSITSAGTAGNLKTLQNYQNEHVIVDFSGEAYNGTNRGISLSGQYWHIKGLDIYKAGDNGMYISGSNNIIELCILRENCDSGMQLDNGAANNQIINCDSYYNYDYQSTTPGGNADGFSPKLGVGTGNSFYGCRSWQNSDDGYDGYLSSDSNVTTTYENCWSFKNGYLKDGSQSAGNGNGFKMSGGYYRHNVSYKNCLSFNNKAKGFDQNHDTGNVTIYNCTSFHNGGNNYSLYETLATNKTAKFTNDVNFTGGVNLAAFITQTTNSWQSPFVVTSADFVSIDPNAAYGARNADGSLPSISFMRLSVGSDLIDSGTNVGLPYNGTAPDLGAFEYLPGDCHSDGHVNWLDMECLADNWLDSSCGVCNQADSNGDHTVNFLDFAIMAKNWLE